MTLDEYFETLGCNSTNAPGFHEEDRFYCEKINYIIDKDASFGYRRRPYFRVRGKKVTPVQAFDIISKAEENINSNIQTDSGYIEFGGLLYCDLLGRYPFSFVRPDGYIGFNSISRYKYPEYFDLFAEFAEFLYHFPYLDFVIAFADWEEIPDYAYNMERTKRFHPCDYCGFEEAIDFGVHVYNGTIHHLNKENTRKLYEQYNKEYGFINQGIYRKDYYEDIKSGLITEEYADEIFRARNLTKDDLDVSFLRNEYIDRRLCSDDDLLFTYKMLLAERHFEDPTKFKAWHVAQFLYDAMEMKYSAKDAWSLLVESSVGQSLLWGSSPDASASEADTELYGRYKKDAEEHLPRLERLTNMLTVLFEVLDKYKLPFDALFGRFSFMYIYERYGYNISCDDMYKILIDMKEVPK